MKTSFPLYEGDGYLHFRGTPAAREKQEAGDSDSLDLSAIEQRARALRSKAIVDMFRRAAGWFEVKIHNAKQRDVEAYLAQSTDHADLERRLKEIERKPRLEFC